MGFLPKMAGEGLNFPGQTKRAKLIILYSFIYSQTFPKDCREKFHYH